MSVNKNIKKALSILLCLCMLVQNVPVMALAAAGDNLCDHHPEHTPECGYVAPVEGRDCTHAHSEECYQIVACRHTHSDACADPCTHECTVDSGCITMERDCRHVHGDCGYSQGTAEVPCGHVCGEECAEGCVHTEHLGCGYAPATEGTPCTHACAVLVDSADSCYKLLCAHKDGGHDDTCGYAAGAKGSACTYVCQESHGEEPEEIYPGCAHHNHDEACGGMTNACSFLCETCVAEIQAMVNALPDMEDITDESKPSVAQALSAIDARKHLLSDAGVAAIDFDRYADAAFAMNTPENFFGFCIEKRYEASAASMPQASFAFLDAGGEAATVNTAEGAAVTSVSPVPNEGAVRGYLPVGTYTLEESVAGSWDLALTVNGEANSGLSFSGESGRVYSLMASNTVAGYNITVDSADNGSVKVTVNENETNRAMAGNTVTLTVAPNEGYILEALTVSCGEGPVATTEGENGTYTFTMPEGDVTVTAVFEPHVHNIDYTTGRCSTCQTQFAAEVKNANGEAMYYTSFEDALSAWLDSGNQTLTLLDAVCVESGSIQVKYTGQVLNLNGRTLTGSVSVGNSNHTNGYTGGLTVRDNTGNGKISGQLRVSKGSNAQMTGGWIDHSNQGTGVYVEGNASFAISGGRVTGTSAIDSCGTVSISGNAILEGKAREGSYPGYGLYNSGAVTMSGTPTIQGEPVDIHIASNIPITFRYVPATPLHVSMSSSCSGLFAQADGVTLTKDRFISLTEGLVATEMQGGIGLVTCDHQGVQPVIQYDDNSYHKSTYTCCNGTEYALHTMQDGVCTACGGRSIYFHDGTVYSQVFLYYGEGKYGSMTKLDGHPVWQMTVPAEPGEVSFSFGYYGDSYRTVETEIPEGKNCFRMTGYDYEKQLYTGVWYTYPCTDHTFAPDGYCTACGAACAHATVDGSGTCTACGIQNTVRVTVGQTTVHCVDFAKAVSYISSLTGSETVDITLLDDTSVSNYLTLPARTIELNLNGKNLYVFNLGYASHANVTLRGDNGGVLTTANHYVDEGAQLTLESGTIQSSSGNALVIRGTFVMNGGTVSTTAIDNRYGINVQTGANTSVTITGGTVSSAYSAALTNLNALADITLSGGTFIGGIQNTPSDAYPPLNSLMAAGHKLVDENGNDVDMNSYVIHGTVSVVCNHTTQKDENKATCSRGNICDTCGEEYGTKDTSKHILTYTASNNVITKSCSECKENFSTATITAVDATYDGTAKQTAAVAYSEGWTDGGLTVSYENNVNAGTATARITIDEATASVAFTIEKATVTVTADAKTKPYGQENPALTYTADGLIGSDVLTGDLATDATTTSNAGEYDITVGTLANSNYTITFVGAKLTVTKATVAAPAAGVGYSLDYIRELITVASGYEVVDENETAVTSGSLKNHLGKTLKVRVKETVNTAPLWTEFTLASRPGAPEVTVKNETLKGQQDGQISGLTSDMEYSTDNGATWKVLQNASTITKLGKCTVLVRVKATETAPHGVAQTCTVAEGAAITVTLVDNNRLAADMPQPITGLSYGAKLTRPGDPTATDTDFVFQGWYKDAACTDDWNFDEDTVAAETVTLYAKWKQIYFSVEADIYQHGGQELYTEQVTVQLMRGKDEIAKMEGTGGKFKFAKHVEIGMYNLVAVYTDHAGEHTKTELITIDHSGAYNLILPESGVNSHLTLGNQTPDVMVGGLDEEAAHVKGEEGTDAINVSVTMNVQGKTEEQVDSTVVTQIDQAIAEETNSAVPVAVEYLDIKLEKVVVKNTGSTTTEIKETDSLLEIVVPFNFRGKKAESITVYRHHNGAASALNPIAVGITGNDGAFYLDQDNGYIHIFTRKFSTYAIAYTAEYQVKLDANGGTVSTAELKVQGDAKLSHLPTPVRSGYVFKGWYTAKTGGTKVTTDTVFTADATIYAQWSGYTVTVAGTTNGTVTVDKTEAPAEAAVTVTVTPQSGYRMSTLTVKDASGNLCSLGAVNDDAYLFRMPAANVTVTATFTKVSTATADPTNPKTGDAFHLLRWSGMMLTTLTGMAVLLWDGKKRFG